MATQDDFTEMAAQFERQERALAYLYRTLAEKLKEHERFWLDLSAQEDTHALMLRTLREMLEQGDLAPGLRPFKVQELQNTLERASAALNFVRRNPLTMAEALTVGIELENMMLEMKMFEPQPEDPAELKRILRILQEDTTKHHASMQSRLNEIARDGG